MKVLILNTNRERTPHTLVPLGPCLVASAASAAGHDVRLLDLTFSRLTTQAAAEAVKRERPDLVGVSIRNLDNCDCARPTFYLDEIAQVVAACRGSGAETIVLGGPAVTVAPEQSLRYVRGDFAVVGEGESSFPMLLSRLEKGEAADDVPGIAILGKEGLALTSPIPVQDLSQPSNKSVQDWLQVRRYLSCGSTMPLQTKRGCPFNCLYCLYPKIEGQGIRLRDPALVASEVLRAEQMGFRTAEFVDSVFNVPEQHAVDCCEAIANNSSTIGLQSLELNPAGCSAELVQAMNAAGFAAVGCTAESGSDAVLSSLGKGFTTEQLNRAARELKKLNALKLWIFMLGGPGETEATVTETSKFIEQSLTSSDLIYISCGVRILPGTGLHARAIEDKVISPDDDLLLPSFYFSPHLSHKRAMEIIYSSAFPTANIISLPDGNHWLLPLLQKTAHSIGLAPPYWRLAPLWNRLRRPSLPSWLQREDLRC